MSKRRTKITLHDEFLNQNPIIVQTPKKFSNHDIKSIQPMTRNQSRVFDLWKDGYNIVLSGSAGTGKTLVSIYLALKDLLDNETKYDKIVIIRSAVASRDVGFLPGTIEEKMEVYEEPYSQVFDFLFKKKNQYKFMKEAGLVEFHSSSYLRGTTFDDALVIMDEVAGMNFHEISTCATRLGQNSKLVMIGDVKQNDLIYKKNDVSGFARMLKVADRIPSMRTVTFTLDDIVRSDFVKEFLVADESVV